MALIISRRSSYCRNFATAPDGLTVAEIAARLHLARGTVRNYLSDAIAKLGVSTRHAAAHEARAKGWI